MIKLFWWLAAVAFARETFFARAFTQEPERPRPAQSAVAPEKNEPGLPAGNPVEQPNPALLPESAALPTPIPLPPGLGLHETPIVAATPTPAPISEEQRKANEKRLLQIRVIASENARAKYLRQAASTALSPEARRNFLRAYYITVCSEMRHLAPSLAGSIQVYLRDRLRQISRAKDSPVLPQ